MDTNNKYGPFSRDILIRYLKGELSAEDSWKIEKAMQDDPMLSDAMEGLESFPDKDLAARDIEELEQRINTRSVKGKSRTLQSLARIAAALLVLAVSTFIIIEFTKKQSRDRSGIVMQKSTDKIDTVVTGIFSDGGIRSDQGPDDIPPSRQDKSAQPSDLTEDSPIIEHDLSESETEIVVDEDLVKAGNEIRDVAAEEGNAGLKSADSSASENIGYINEFILSKSDDEKDARPGILDDFMTKGAGEVSRVRESKREAKPTGEAKAALSEEIAMANYIEPHPVIGDSSYVNYIRTNLRYPDMARRNNIEGDVILRFSVGTDSSLVDIIVISGPGRGCREEAVRLLREGPQWVPAYSNGIPVKSEVFYKIPFRITGN
ncbi:MAG TPA: energy transducer TonB [Cyclobacteriaceae bacterium]|nr:energy transducer TonB [Cyclobacteriaceae bacterium]